MNASRIGILIFATAALTGPWYTTEGYSPVRNLISELGAQNTQNNYVMVAGFLALGLGIAVAGLRRFSKPMIPFIAFGLFMALAGLLAHKPLAPGVEFNETAHQAHAGLATFAGISITVGLLWQAVLVPSKRSRVVVILLAVLCLALPICMIVFPEVQGLIQRCLYVLLLGWIWIHYPLRVIGDRGYNQPTPLDTRRER